MKIYYAHCGTHTVAPTMVAAYAAYT